MMLKWLTLWLLGIGAAQAADMIALRYIDQDPDNPPYVTRIFVTPHFMRMDTGDDNGDFILLDRRKHKLLNVLRGNNMVMVFTPGKLPSRPADWSVVLDAQPAMRGTQRFSLSVKEVVCTEGVAAKGAAPDAARALAEMKAILATTQYRVWKESPPSMQHECELAIQVWDTGATLKLGLPLEEREYTGRTRKLESETRLPLDPGLFRVPKGMPTMNMPSS